MRQGEDIAIDASGERVYVLSLGEEGISFGIDIIDTTTQSLIDRLPVGGTDVGVSPDGTFVYVATGSRLLVVDSSSAELVASVSPTGPERLAISPDGSRIYATAVASSEVLVVDRADGAIQARVLSPVRAPRSRLPSDCVCVR